MSLFKNLLWLADVPTATVRSNLETSTITNAKGDTFTINALENGDISVLCPDGTEETWTSEEFTSASECLGISKEECIVLN